MPRQRSATDSRSSRVGRCDDALFEHLVERSQVSRIALIDVHEEHVGPQGGPQRHGSHQVAEVLLGAPFPESGEVGVVGDGPAGDVVEVAAQPKAHPAGEADRLGSSVGFFHAGDEDVAYSPPKKISRQRSR